MVNKPIPAKLPEAAAEDTVPDPTCPNCGHYLSGDTCDKCGVEPSDWKEVEIYKLFRKWRGTNKRLLVTDAFRAGYAAAESKLAAAQPDGWIAVTTTSRGFTRIEFTDEYNVSCSLQKSSLATEDAIWLGCNEADPKVLVPGKSWQLVPMPKGYIANTRMHLTREHVARLLPYLNHFVEFGELPTPPVREKENEDA